MYETRQEQLKILKEQVIKISRENAGEETKIIKGEVREKETFKHI